MNERFLYLPPASEYHTSQVTVRVLVLPIAAFLIAIWLSPGAMAQHMNARIAPCQQPVSTVESERCFVDAAKKADVKLNRTYGAIQSFLRSEDRIEDLNDLRKAQRLWMAFRDANCAAARSLYGRGTGGPVTFWACIEAQTRERTEDLKTGYGWLLSKSGHRL